jgi:hypothetical protein
MLPLFVRFRRHAGPKVRATLTIKSYSNPKNSHAPINAYQSVSLE